MAKRLQLNPEQLQDLLEGDDIELRMSPKRTLVLGTKSDVEIKKELLRKQYEYKVSKLEGKNKD